jgi:hypothetical protein
MPYTYAIQQGGGMREFEFRAIDASGRWADVTVREMSLDLARARARRMLPKGLRAATLYLIQES